MQRATVAVLVAASLTVGLAGLAGTAAAESIPQKCPTTANNPVGGDIVIEEHCGVAEAERCDIVMHDPLGMPTIVPFVCVTVDPCAVGDTTSTCAIEIGR